VAGISRRDAISYREVDPWTDDVCDGISALIAILRSVAVPISIHFRRERLVSFLTLTAER